MRRAIVFAVMLSAFAPAQAFAECGGEFGAFVKGLKKEAVARGFPRSFTNKFFRSVEFDPKVIRMDRAQGVFKMTFTDFARRVISKSRMVHGKKNAKKYASVLARAKATYGVDPSVILAFWALETDYGAVQGDFNTANALVTLAHDCRRPVAFSPSNLFGHGACPERRLRSQPPQQALGRAKSAWCKCCPTISSTEALTGMGTGMCA